MFRVSQQTIFKNDTLSNMIPEGIQAYTTLIIVIVLVVISKILLDLYLETKSGYLLLRSR